MRLAASVTLALVLGGCSIVSDEHLHAEDRARDWRLAEAEVRFMRGGPANGVPSAWALAGYRAGVDALARLGTSRDRARDLIVVVRCPREAHHAAMIDGVIVATGASPGKLNLAFEPTADADRIEIEVVFLPRERLLTYRFPPLLIARLDDPTASEAETDRWLETASESDVFSVVESDARGSLSER